jgi:carboxyl-terminal processing protease
MLKKHRSLYLIPVLVAACAVVGGIYGPNAQVASAASGSDDEITASVKNFTHLYDTVEQNFADPVSADKAIYNGAIPGMLRTLDPHSNFFDPKALAAMREDQKGHYAGVGMRVEGKANQAGVMQTIVVEPFVGSPAYKAGLRPNDVISNVNGKNTDGLTSTEVADLLKGPKGTPVNIKVVRGEGADQLSFSIIRDEINRSSVPSAFMIKPGIGYLKLEEFIETTGADFDSALKKLDEDNLKGLVLDLRGNPGGLLTEAVSVAGHLLPKGSLIVSHHGRASQERSYKATEGNHGRNYPIVVIVNRNSASASEIVPSISSRPTRSNCRRAGRSMPRRWLSSTTGCRRRSTCSARRISRKRPRRSGGACRARFTRPRSAWTNRASTNTRPIRKWKRPLPRCPRLRRC